MRVRVFLCFGVGLLMLIGAIGVQASKGTAATRPVGPILGLSGGYALSASGKVWEMTDSGWVHDSSPNSFANLAAPPIPTDQIVLWDLFNLIDTNGNGWRLASGETLHWINLGPVPDAVAIQERSWTGVKHGYK